MVYPGKSKESDMHQKQKVTLYIPPGLHRQLKIRSAVDTESMSALVEKSIAFYLKHPEIVEDVESACGQTHRVYECPECRTSLVKRDGKLAAIQNKPSILPEELSVDVDQVRQPVKSNQDSQGEEELVPC